jgi:HEAT repeat protein
MQSVSTPTTGSQWEQLVAGMPRPDKEEKILKDVEAGQVEKIVADLLAGGREAVVALVDMLVEPGGERNDSPARHALHALVIHVGGLADDSRRATAAALAATLTDRKRPAGVKAFILRQLQLCGTASEAPALGRLLADEQLSSDAVMALLAIRSGAAEQFRAALPDVTGPQRVAVIQALGNLMDSESVTAVRRAAARDPDPVAQLEAAWALANIGDPGSADAVLKCADDARGFDRIRATDACLLLAENLAAAGKKADAAKIYQHLRDTRTDESEAHIRGVAERALRG